MFIGVVILAAALAAIAQKAGNKKINSTEHQEATAQYADKIVMPVLTQAEGHLIGNHTYSHMQLTKKNRETFKEELVKTSEIIFSY